MLKISYIGYRTVTLAAAKDMRVVMSEDNMKLDEVVVVGYGVQKKVNLTGAVASVKSDEILKAQSANTSNALIGQIPGLIAKQTTGEPDWTAHKSISAVLPLSGGNFTYLYHRRHRTPCRRLCPHRSQ